MHRSALVHSSNSARAKDLGRRSFQDDEEYEDEEEDEDLDDEDEDDDEADSDETSSDEDMFDDLDDEAMQAIDGKARADVEHATRALPPPPLPLRSGLANLRTDTLAHHIIVLVVIAVLPLFP